MSDRLLRRVLVVLSSSWMVACAAAGASGRGPRETCAPARSASPGQVGQSEAGALEALYAREWEWQLQDSPTFATEVGDPRYNDRLPDLSPEAIEARKAHARALQKELASYPSAGLTPDQALNLELFRRQVNEDVEGQRFPSEDLVLSQFTGPQQDLNDIAEAHPKLTQKDFEDYLSRLRAVPRYIDQSLALLKKGLAAHVTQPRAVLAYVGPALQAHLVTDATHDPLYALVFAELPRSVSAADAEALRARARQLLEQEVRPAFLRLQAFFEKEYLPQARTEVGWSALPDGAAWYAYRVKIETTLHKSPEEIHQIGLSEVKRLHATMEKLPAEAGFKGSLPAFFRYARTDPKFFYGDAGSLISGYRDLAKRIDPALVKLFGKLPRLPYGIAPVPAYSEKGMPAAYYQRGSIEGGRAGMFYANTHNLKARPKWEMQSLTLHEAVPGHHLQLALAQEQDTLPQFRRHAGYTAFIEGWGLYSEQLGADLGLYKDPMDRFGELNNEMWRAVRLVLDTGLHTQGWSRQQAIDYFTANTGRSAEDMAVEVDRYIAWGGQALAYKMGQLKISELRARAEKALGARFDLRRFHDFLLAEGGLPLDVLERRTDGWISRSLADSAAAPGPPATGPR